MKLFFLMYFVLVPLSLFALEPGFYTSNKVDQVWAVEKKADVSVGFTIDCKIDIGIANEVFTSDQLVSYFQHLRHKQLVVCVFQKNMRSEVENIKLSSDLNKYFLKCGFERVVILQGHAFGVGVYSDQLNTLSQQGRPVDSASERSQR